MKLFFIFFDFLLFKFILSTTYPVALFHGIGDSCENLEEYAKYLSKKLNVYVACIESGGGFSDVSTPIYNQSIRACNEIKNNPNFETNFSVIGYSQGGLIARYIIQKCDMKGKVKKFIGVGTPNMGVSRVPKCFSGIVCYFFKKFTDTFIYTNYMMNHLGPAGYYRDNMNIKEYVDKSNFLPILNNEKNYDHNSTLRFKELELCVLIKFNKDTMIYPKETAWFQYVDENDNLIDLKESSFYNNDYIGLKYLNNRGKVLFYEVNNEHLHMNSTEFEKYILLNLK